MTASGVATDTRGRHGRSHEGTYVALLAAPCEAKRQCVRALVTSTVTAPRRQLGIPFRPPRPTTHRPPPPLADRGIGPMIGIHFHCACGFRQSPLTCIHVRLLGPCFKTGRMEHRLFAHRERPSSDSYRAPKEGTVGGTRRGHRRIPRVDTRRKLTGRP